MRQKKLIQNRIRRFAAAGIGMFLLLSAVFSLRAYATDDQDDFNYSGPLDADTNEPVREDRETDNGRTRLSDTMVYDKNTRSFVYAINNGLNEIRSSAADGMVTNSTVTIYSASDTNIIVHKDGTELTGKIQTLKEPGEYVVSTQSGSDLQRVFSFSIVGKTTNGLQHFTVPEGFYMADVKLDGSGYYYTRYGADLTAEGEYTLTYVCSASDTAYSLQVTIDRTPPVLTFSGKINSENQVRSALEFTGVEEGGTVTVVKDNNLITVRADSEGVYKLADSGLYTIRAYDAAGNMTEYQYRVMMYFNISSIIFVLLAALLVIGIGIYVLVRRNSLKIG
ncbi:MAG: hypothetical protein IKS18_03220 [Lachnospiraceae bacterium]|nr:hypothetical protein [Lachnospiraceae bacterium]